MIHDLNREFQDLSGEVQALTAARDTAPDQIGRASCRERV